MNSAQHPATRRVLLAARTGSVAEQALHAARAIAGILQAELTALVVEDPNLVRMAALPFTREIGAASGAVRAIERVDMERALRLQADRLRRSLDPIAALRIERGAFAQHMLQELAESVAAVFSPLPGTYQAFRARPQARKPEEVVVVYRDAPGDARALALAMQLSESAGQLRVAITAATDEQFRARKQAVLAQVPGAVDRLQLVRLTVDHPLDLAIAAAAQHSSAALVISSEGTGLTAERLTLLLEQLHSPLVLLT